MSDAVREMFAPGPIPDHVLEGDSYAALVRCDEEYVAALRAGTGLPDWFYDPAGRPIPELVEAEVAAVEGRLAEMRAEVAAGRTHPAHTMRFNLE